MKANPIIILGIAVLLSSFAVPDNDVPFLTGRVTDNAYLLSSETHSLLTDSLKAHEMRTTNQVVILTIPAIGGESIEEYANRVFNEWKLGQQGKDNGVLIIVVPDERRMRIEVGYGLEGILTDLTASRIIQFVMTPKFRDGDYEGGIVDGALTVIDILEGGYLDEGLTFGETGDSEGAGLSGLDNPDLTITERILFGAFIFGIIGLFTVIGIMTPGFGWFLYVFLIPFWAMFPIVVFGTRGALICLISYLIIYPGAKLFLNKSEWYNKAKANLKTKGKASIGGFTFSSGSSGSSWSSGGGSSGGFSGGGGRSGGGGSSGSW
jgi:uncharacterized protein